jgi:hypothetical protein
MTVKVSNCENMHLLRHDDDRRETALDEGAEKPRIGEMIENMPAAAAALLTAGDRFCSRSYWEYSYEQVRKTKIADVVRTQRVGCKGAGVEELDAELLAGKAYVAGSEHAAETYWEEDDLYSEKTALRAAEVECVIAAEGSRRRR